MCPRNIFALFAALFLMLPLSLRADSFAGAVVEYAPGAGFSPGFDDPSAALGEPSRVTPGLFGGPVDPFSPPYLAEQLVSIGAEGSLTISFNAPILDSPQNPFGLDFIIFGNNGFTIVNGDFEGGGVTDGSTFTFDPPGASVVYVSEDNVSYYELVPPPGMAAAVDGLFPTDGSGDFLLPVDPTLGGDDFAGEGLAGIAALYGGSGGGTGFDLSWARTEDGQSAALTSANYVRLEVLLGKVEVDGFAVVPEPGAGALLLAGGILVGLTGWRRRVRNAGGRASKG